MTPDTIRTEISGVIVLTKNLNMVILQKELSETKTDPDSNRILSTDMPENLVAELTAYILKQRGFNAILMKKMTGIVQTELTGNRPVEIENTSLVLVDEFQGKKLHEQYGPAFDEDMTNIRKGCVKGVCEPQ